MLRRRARREVIELTARDLRLDRDMVKFEATAVR
jgi:hypothetical protein